MYSAQEIAFIIKQTSKSKNLTIKQLLENCELSINTISELSKGKQISYISFSKIADCLDCSVDYLLGRSDNPNIGGNSVIQSSNIVNGNNGDHSPLTVTETEQQDEMTKELVKAFCKLCFSDKMKIMNTIMKMVEE